MSCMATLATRFARRCKSRSSVGQAGNIERGHVSDTASARGSGSATAGSSISAACTRNLRGVFRRQVLRPNPTWVPVGAGTCAAGSGRPLPVPFPRRQRLLRRRARPSHGYRADSTRRRRNSRARTAPRRAPKRPSARAASPAARCSAGWTNRPPRDRRRPDAARPPSAAAAPDCRAKPGKRLLRGPAPEIVGVLSSDSLPFSDYGNGIRGCQLTFPKGVPAHAAGALGSWHDRS